MRKRTTTSLQLVLITAVLASCSRPEPEKSVGGEPQQRVFMRADSTAPYTEVTQQYGQHQRAGGHSMGSALLWYMAFRHMGGGLGYANNNLHPSSVAGTNAAKANAYKATRGGFGRTASESRSSSFGS